MATAISCLKSQNNRNQGKFHICSSKYQLLLEFEAVGSGGKGAGEGGGLGPPIISYLYKAEQNT